MYHIWYTVNVPYSPSSRPLLPAPPCRPPRRYLTATGLWPSPAADGRRRRATAARHRGAGPGSASTCRVRISKVGAAPARNRGGPAERFPCPRPRFESSRCLVMAAAEPSLPLRRSERASPGGPASLAAGVGERPCGCRSRGEGGESALARPRQASPPSLRRPWQTSFSLRPPACPCPAQPVSGLIAPCMPLPASRPSPAGVVLIGWPAERGRTDCLAQRGAAQGGRGPGRGEA